MNELYGASDTAAPASDTSAATLREIGSRQGSADTTRGRPDAAQGNSSGGYSGADIEALLAAEERLPESRTRQDAAADTWSDTTDDLADSQWTTEYDGDLEALLATEDHLPESRTRQEASAATWDDTTESGDDDPGSFSGDPASEYDGDVSALIAAEDHLPESRPRQEAATVTWDGGGQDGGADSGSAGATSGTPDTATGPSSPDGEGADGTPAPYESLVAVHASDGSDVPVTVAYLSPEDRTLGDTTPTGIGRKPTGEEFLDMESEGSADGGLDRFLRERTEEADDLHDALGSVAETVHDLRLPGPPGSGHAHEGHPVHEPMPPAGPGFTDLAGSTALIGVAVLTAFHHWIWDRRKGDTQ